MFFIDVQGTLLSDKDKSLITGAKEFIELLNAKNLPYVIITNNTKKLNFLEELKSKKELAIKENAYLDPFCVLENIIKPCKIAAFGSNEFLQSLENLGYELDFENPKAVLVASYDDFSFKDFAKMIEFAKNGVRFIAMHETSIYKKDGFLYPGVGSIMVMLENAVKFEYEVVGKPSFAFYNEALNLMKKQDENASFDKICIISDDFKGDLLKARDLKMECILVLSGKISDTKGLDTSILKAVYPSVFEFMKDNICKI